MECWSIGVLGFRRLRRSALVRLGLRFTVPTLHYSSTPFFQAGAFAYKAIKRSAALERSASTISGAGARG
jgi:hypothetical protein